jgi:hypothetical protein
MVDWSTLPNAGTNNANSLSLKDIEDEFGGDGDDIELEFYYEGGAYVPKVAWNYRIPDLYNQSGNIKDPLDPLSLNAFYGAVWGTFVNFQMVGAGGGGGAGSSNGRGSNNVGNGNAGGASNLSMDADSNFGGSAAGGAGGLHGDSANYQGAGGGGSIFGTGGGVTAQNTNGANGTGWGSGGAGGGGDQASGKGDNIGYGGTGGAGGSLLEGGSPEDPDINNNRYKYNSVITFSPGNAGSGGSGSFSTGGNGRKGRVGITYDGETYYFSGNADHILGSFATEDDVP